MKIEQKYHKLEFASELVTPSFLEIFPYATSKDEVYKKSKIVICCSRVARGNISKQRCLIENIRKPKLLGFTHSNLFATNDTTISVRVNNLKKHIRKIV